MRPIGLFFSRCKDLDTPPTHPGKLLAAHLHTALRDAVHKAPGFSPTHPPMIHWRESLRHREEKHRVVSVVQVLFNLG